ARRIRTLPALPGLVRGLPLLIRIAALRGAGMDPPGVLSAAALPHRARRGDRAHGPGHDLPGPARRRRPPPPARPLDPPRLPVRIGDRGDGLLVALPNGSLIVARRSLTMAAKRVPRKMAPGARPQAAGASRARAAGPRADAPAATPRAAAPRAG